MNSKSFRDVADDVYNIIEKMITEIESSGDDCGSILTILLPQDFDPLAGCVQGVAAPGDDSDRWMHRSYIALCLALLQQGITPKQLLSALRESKRMWNDG